jgi:hypothetical protein
MEDHMTKNRFFLLNLLLIFAMSSAACHRRENRPSKNIPPMKIEGAVEVTSVKDAQDMALPLDQFKGIKFIRSSDFFAKFSDRKNTPSGLYLLDTELIPKQLPEILARNGVALGPNGSLVNQKGEKAVMILGYRLAAVTPQKQGAPPAAFPFALEWVSFWWSWVADEGFCRSLTASTGADAWGPIIPFWGQRVHTNIEQIESFAAAADARDDKICNNCPWEFAQANRDFGCFWPAHGGGQWGWVDFKDGSFHWSANW